MKAPDHGWDGTAPKIVRPSYDHAAVARAGGCVPTGLVIYQLEGVPEPKMLRTISLENLEARRVPPDAKSEPDAGPLTERWIFAGKGGQAFEWRLIWPFNDGCIK